MIIRTITAALAFALSGSVYAAPTLRGEILVSDAIVTVGDMFDDAGTLAEEPLFRAPLPGTTGNVDVAAVRSATARVGLTQFEVNGLTEVRVSRASTLVDEDLLSTVIADDLRHRGILGQGMSADMLFTNPVEAMQAEATDTPARLDNLRYLPGNGTFSARFTIAGFDRPLDLTGSIAISIEAPHLAANLPAGTVLRPEHVVMRPVSVQQADAQGIANFDQLIGMALNRQSREGMLLRPTDVSTPMTVSKNDLVTIFYRQGPLTLTVKGQAVSGAAAGGSVQVLNLVSKRVISATAIAPGTVEVSTAPMTVAGL